MARVFIESDNGAVRIEVRQDVETGEAVAYCEIHGEEITDRGRFEDTCEAVANHIAWQHGPQYITETGAATARPLVSDETIAEAAAMAERDRAAGGPPWEISDHPDNDQPGGWHHGQIR